MTHKLCAKWMKVVTIIILVTYMYGAMCVKYVSGAESFVEAFSDTFMGTPTAWEEKWKGKFDPYYLGLIIFAALSLGFSFGNIENSKGVQIVTGFLRVFVIILMYIGTFYSLGKNGIHRAPVFDFKE